MVKLNEKMFKMEIIMKKFRRTVSFILVIAMIASLLSVSVFAANGYSVTVDGTSFDCEEDKSGSNWSYTAETKTLTLNNYNGGSIVSKGNINIVIGGNTTINGVSGSDYSSFCCGISVNGTLDLSVEANATVKICGAENVYIKGGDGVVATALNLSSHSSSSLEICGGNSESDKGGFAIKASSLTLETKKLIAKGGNDSSALYFATEFKVKSGSNATFISGRKYVSAITYLSNATYSFDSNIRSVFANEASSVYISTYGSFTYGDINADGDINAIDAVILAQSLAGWDLELDEAAISSADVFYDGKLNAADAVLLAQYLAHWDGITLGK